MVAAPDSFDGIIEVLDDGAPISLVKNRFNASSVRSSPTHSALGTGTLQLLCPGKFYFALAAAFASRMSFIAARATATNMIKSTRPYVYHRPPRLDICFSIKAPRGLLVAIEFENRGRIIVDVLLVRSLKVRSTTWATITCSSA